MAAHKNQSDTVRQYLETQARNGNTRAHVSKSADSAVRDRPLSEIIPQLQYNLLKADFIQRQPGKIVHDDVQRYHRVLENTSRKLGVPAQGGDMSLNRRFSEASRVANGRKSQFKLTRY